jgi:AcrR family transcriptional regulator
MAETTEQILEALCSDPTSSRERLLHVAGMMFADRGIDAVSTRELTKAARANLSAIAYYFGGKEGLYNEAINHTIDSTQALIGGAEAKLRADLAEAGGDRGALAGAASAFVRAVLTALLGLGPEHWPRRLIMREIDHPTPAFDRLYEAIFEPLTGAFRDLLVAATGCDPADAETVILTNALLSSTASSTRSSWRAPSRPATAAADGLSPPPARRRRGRRSSGRSPSCSGAPCRGRRCRAP